MMGTRNASPSTSIISLITEKSRGIVASGASVRSACKTNISAYMNRNNEGMVDPSSVGIVKPRFLTMANGPASSNAKPSEVQRRQTG